MPLFLVPYQFILPGMEIPGPVAPLDGALSNLRDRRDGHAWLRQAIAYCEFMAGRSLRPNRDKAERALRSDYLDAIRVITDILLSTTAEPQLMRRCPPPKCSCASRDCG